MARPKSGGKRRSPRRRRRPGRKANSSGPRSRVPSSGMTKVPCLRSFSCFPKQLKQNDSPSWLETMIRYGSIAMKTFAMLVASDPGVGARWQMTGTTETILIGPEDLIWNTPVRGESIMSTSSLPEYGGVALSLAPTLEYQQGRILHLVVKLNCGSVASKKAGRVVMAAQSLTREDAETYSLKKTTPRVPSFNEISLMPGAVSAPYGVGITQRWSPRMGDLGQSYTMLGQSLKPSEAAPSLGGIPVVAVYVGYQDFASSSPDPSELYAPEEALLNVDISGSVQLQTWGQRWIRTYPIQGDANLVSACIGNARFEIPHRAFAPGPVGLTTAWSALPPAAQKLARIRAGASGNVVFLPEKNGEEFEIVDLKNLRVGTPA